MSITNVNAQERLRATMALAALRKNSAAAPAAAGAGSVTRQPDAVTISDKARALASAQKTAASTAPSRDEKISAIKAALANGTYNVDSRTLANTLVTNYAQ
jgi:flagellar biosynthesis anti-sigma factor FlgM